MERGNLPWTRVEWINKNTKTSYVLNVIWLLNKIDSDSSIRYTCNVRFCFSNSSNSWDQNLFESCAMTWSQYVMDHREGQMWNWRSFVETGLGFLLRLIGLQSLDISPCHNFLDGPCNVWTYPFGISESLDILWSQSLHIHFDCKQIEICRIFNFWNNVPSSEVCCDWFKWKMNYWW